MTLLDVNVGFASITHIFRVPFPLRVDWPAFESNLRNSLCLSDRRTMIERGASYDFEYWETSSNLIAKFAIESCP
jgi:hypothetical protein